MAFTILNNVHVTVYDSKRSIIRQEYETHNKASRNMITGILCFLHGYFTPTVLNDAALNAGAAKSYIPCFFNVGDGGVVIVDGKPSFKPDSRTPELEEGWNEVVDYAHKRLVHEFFLNDDGTFSNTRQRISQITDTLAEPNTADMDSIYFYCEMPPGSLNQYYGNNAVCVSELGLFASQNPGTDDLLASIKLGNYPNPENPDNRDSDLTNTLYVRPDDTLIVRWVITIAAIGKDSVLKANVADEYGDIITTTITKIPDVGNIEIIVDPPVDENGG
jgi:hypothetical protein